MSMPSCSSAPDEMNGVVALHIPEAGRGRALSLGWLASDADVLAYMDIDLSTDLGAFPELVDMIAVLGDAALGDRLERIAFNALPGTFSKDMWAHQYDQQSNQVMCDLRQRAWTTNGAESNLYGLEPNFGCCTANLHQGWPKFVASLWMATPDDGLVAIAYGPNRVETTVRGGVRVHIDEDTDYPFRGEIGLAVPPAHDATFPPVL